MKERIIDKRLKDGEEEAELSKKFERKIERLDEENEITITILSGIKDTPKEKIIYNYSKDLSMYGTKIQGNVLFAHRYLSKNRFNIKEFKRKKNRFRKSKKEQSHP
ncbi:MAG: hypothetical protein ACLQBQ_07900 [Smithella sp.]